MKGISSFLLLLVFYSVSGQTTETASYYYKGKKISFSLNYGRVVIRLKPGEATAARSKQLAVAMDIPDSAIKISGNAALLLAKIPATLSLINKKNKIAGLLKQSYVQFVHPSFKSSYGKDMGYGDELVVKLKNSLSVAKFNKIVQQFGCVVVKKYSFADDIYVLSAGQSNKFDALATANRLYETGFFEYSEPDLTIFDGLFTDPNDPLYSYQWAHKNTGAPIQYNGVPGADMNVQQAWTISTGAGIKVAVIDEGVDINHADLAGNMLQGYDCIYGTSNPGDGQPLSSANAHGTNCTGIIAAIANNNIGIAGVAPDCKIIPINLAAGNGYFTSDINIASGFDYAWQHGADVITNSWGGGTPSSTIDDAIARAVTNGRNGKGSVVLFASGNNNAGLSYPASNPNVISVGGVNMCGQRKSPGSCDGEYWWGASYGTGLDVVAPCVKIASTDISGSGGYNTASDSTGDYFLTFNGTSSATPNAAGVVALILSVNNNLAAAQVRTILETTCDKLPGYSYTNVAEQPNGTWNSETGHGRVDAFHAVQAAASGVYCNVQIKASGATRLCPGTNTTIAVINPVAGTSYQWRKDSINLSTGNSIIVNTSGSYDVVAIAQNGCIATSAPVLVTVLNNLPPLSVSAGIDTLVCPGTPVKLGGTPVAANGAPWLSDKRAYGMDILNNHFVRFSLNNPVQYDTIIQGAVGYPDLSSGAYFSGGDFTPYGYYAVMTLTNKLVKIDTATGAEQLIGVAAPPAGDEWLAITWDPKSKNLYGLASPIARTGNSSELCIIDPFTAAVHPATFIALGPLLWISVNNEGQLYAMDEYSYVYRIDKISGVFTQLPNTIGVSVGYAQSADFDPLTDSLYAAAFSISQDAVSDLRIINTGTGTSTLIGSLGGLSEINALAIAGPAYQYNWSPATGLNSTNVAVPVATVYANTTYTLTVTDMCGNASTNQVTVNVAPSAVATITAVTDSICVGDSVRLNATANNMYSYQWYRNGISITGATDSFYVTPKGGTYTVQLNGTTCNAPSMPYVVKTCEIRLNSFADTAVCKSYFYDSGGPDSNYNDAEIFIRTIRPAVAGAQITVTFNSFNTLVNDMMYIYDGPTQNSPLLAQLRGTPAMPLSYTSTNGALTFLFESQSITTAPGWEAVLNCSNIYRSHASGNASELATWEIKTANGFIPAYQLPTILDDSIIIQSGHTVIIDDSMQLDQIWVQQGATLQVEAPFNLHDGPGNDLQVDGAMIINSSGYITGTGSIILNGNLDNSSSPANNVLATLYVSGTTVQNITAGGSFGSVYITNPSVFIKLKNNLAANLFDVNAQGGITTFTADNPYTFFTVNSSLGLEKGRIIMVYNTILVTALNCSVDSYTQQGFVEGQMQRNFQGGYGGAFFPVGNGVYRPVSIGTISFGGTVSTYQVQVINSAPDSRALPATIDRVSQVRYYQIYDVGSTGVLTGTIQLSYGADDGVSDSTMLHIARDDGNGNWVDLGGSAIFGSPVIQASGFNNYYQTYVLANVKGGSNLLASNSALPVNWLSVSADIINRQVLVTWIVENEQNVKNYTLQRSADGLSFTDLQSINATTIVVAEKQYQAIDAVPLTNNNYYRIRQADNDGRYSFSKIVRIKNADNNGFVITPNPATDVVTIKNDSPIFQLQCFNNNGQLMYNVKPGSNQWLIPLHGWAAGVYYVKIVSDKNVSVARFIKN